VSAVRRRESNNLPAVNKEETLTRPMGRTVVAAVLAAALSWFVAIPIAHADDRGKCQHAVERAEARLDRAIHDHGDHSHEAEDRRRDLNAERQRCWDQYHQWWNGKEHRWETEQNWDHDNH
jgi:Ni/Co efflux regulator RcnB